MKKIILIIFLFVLSISLFAQKPIEYKLKNGIKESKNYTYDIVYPYFNNKTHLGAFANKKFNIFLKDNNGIIDDWAKEYKVNNEKIKAKVIISRSDTFIISGYFVADFEAQGNVVINTFNYGLLNDIYKTIEISDMFYNAKDEMWSWAFEELEKNPEAVYLLDGTLTTNKEPQLFRKTFILTKNNIVFFFTPGTIAPKENGQFMYKFEHNYVPVH